MADIKQRVAYPMTRVPDHYVSVVRVPEGETMYAGMFVVADTIDAAIAGNYQVRVPSAPTADNIKTEIVGVVINGGFDQLADGRRPDGQPDYSQYEFNAGDVITIVWCLPKVIFYLSDDCLTAGTLTENTKAIVPTATTMVPSASDTVPAAGAVKSYFKTMARKTVRSGGMYGAGFINGFVCEAVNQ